MRALLQAVKRFGQVDAQVALFDKMLRNRVDEGFWKKQVAMSVQIEQTVR